VLFRRRRARGCLPPRRCRPTALRRLFSARAQSRAALAGAVWLTYALGRRLFDPARGLAGGSRVAAVGADLATDRRGQRHAVAHGARAGAFHVWHAARTRALAPERAPVRLVGGFGWASAVCCFSPSIPPARWCWWRSATRPGAFRAALARVLAAVGRAASRWSPARGSRATSPDRDTRWRWPCRMSRSKQGDPTAEPAAVRATLSRKGRTIDLNKLGNKTLTTLQENLTSRLWSGGALWLTGFFTVGWLYAFRSAAAESAALGFHGRAGCAAAGAGGAEFGRSERLSRSTGWRRCSWFWRGLLFRAAREQCRSLALAAQYGGGGAVGAAGTAAAARRPGTAPPAFSLPAVFPRAVRRACSTNSRNGEPPGPFRIDGRCAGRRGLVRSTTGSGRSRRAPRFLCDHPRAADRPDCCSRRSTLDRPFFSELNARQRLPGSPASSNARFGEWGGRLRGFAHRPLPAEFPLRPAADGQREPLSCC
jgi:hypothetical protein